MAHMIKKGDFKTCMEYSNSNSFPFTECEQYYRAIDSIGPDAWQFVKRYAFFFEEANKNSPMYRKILDTLTEHGVEHDFSQEPGMPIMGNMWFIAKFGWESFVKTLLN
jgi:hypothetical protein